VKGPQFKVTLFVMPQASSASPPVRVPLRPYLAFISRLEEQLQELEARWAPRTKAHVPGQRTVRRPR